MNEIGNFSSNTHEVIKEVNKGAGALMEYKVYPLSDIRVVKAIDSVVQTYVKLSNVLSKLIFCAYSEYYRVHKIIVDLHDQVRDHAFLYHQKWVDTIIVIKKQYEVGFALVQDFLVEYMESYKNII